MKGQIITIGIVVLGTFHCVFGTPPRQSPSAARIQDEQTRNELEAVLAARDAAANTKDVERLLSFYAPDFAMRLPGDRTLTRQDIEQILRLSMRAESLEHGQSSVIESIKMRGAEVFLEVEVTSFHRQRLQDESIKESRSIDQRRETWVKSEQGWKLRSADIPKSKESRTTIDGKKVEPATAPSNLPSPEPNPEDRTTLRGGYGFAFVYRLKDGSIIKAPVYCDDVRLAEMTGGSFIKVKLTPGKYTFRSEKGPAIDLNVEAGKIYFLVLKLKAGFPKARGLLEVDTSATGGFAYKMPELIDLRPLGSDNIDDRARVIVERQ